MLFSVVCLYYGAQYADYQAQQGNLTVRPDKGIHRFTAHGLHTRATGSPLPDLNGSWNHSGKEKKRWNRSTNHVGFYSVC